VFTTIPQGAQVTLETGAMTTTPNEMANVSLGRHIANISLNGRHILTDTINVSETNVRFPEGKGFYDLREKKSITFESEPNHAMLTLDNKAIGTAPMTIDVPYGSHTITATSGPTETDSKSFEVSADSPSKFILHPVKTQNFEVAGYYGGNKVKATLYIKDEYGRYKQEGNTNGQESYQLNLPIGKKYDMEMSYYGYSKRRTIKVKQGMDPVQKFNIKAKSTFVWPWQKEFDPVIGGVSVGYVQKQYVTRGEGMTLKENIWNEAGASLHGMQLGFHFEPAFHWGLGLYTGLFYECYMSWLDSEDLSFIEHSLYLPVHGYFRLPLSRKIHLALHGGIGMDYVIHGEMSTGSEDDDYASWDDFYGEELFPKRFNLSGEIAVDLRFGPVMITATYSKGLINQKMYSHLGDYTTNQNKLSLGISWVFGTEQ